MVAATLGMGAALWAALGWLTPAMAHADLKGTLALLATCVVGGGVYAALGALLGVIRLSELRYVLRRPPELGSAGVKSADPGEQS